MPLEPLDPGSCGNAAAVIIDTDAIKAIQRNLFTSMFLRAVNVGSPAVGQLRYYYLKRKFRIGVTVSCIFRQLSYKSSDGSNLETFLPTSVVLNRANMNPSMQPTVVLSREQIDFYGREGYLSIPEITTSEEVMWLREIYDRLFSERAGREVGDQFDLAGTDEEGKDAALPQILGPTRYAPELAQGLFRVNAQAIAKQLIGPQATLTGEHMIFKPALTGAETPWHQDEAYWDPDLDYQSMSIWIPLQEATLENGCMWFVPRSHREEVRTHHSIGHDSRIHGLEVDQIDHSTAVACPLSAGGATVHHNRTLHYAGPNISEIPRRAYILIAAAPATPRSESRDFYWNRTKQTAREERARSRAGR